MRRGNSRNTYVVDCMTIDGLENLVLILGGKIAGTWRKNVLDAFRREKAKKNGTSIDDWKKDPRAYDVLVTQFKKNHDEIANAEVKKIEKVGDAQVDAIKEGAAAKKNVADAEVARINAATALLQFDLQQKQNAAGNDTDSTQTNKQPPPSSQEKAATASAAPTPAKEKVRENAPPQKGIHKPTYSRAKKRARGKVKKPSSRAKDKSKPAGEGDPNSIRAYFNKLTLNTDK